LPAGLTPPFSLVAGNWLPALHELEKRGLFPYDYLRFPSWRVRRRWNILHCVKFVRRNNMLPPHNQI
jgi:hypothetical protein